MRRIIRETAIVSRWYLERLEELVEMEWGSVPDHESGPERPYVARHIDPNDIVPIEGLAQMLARSAKLSNRREALPVLPEVS